MITLSSRFILIVLSGYFIQIISCTISKTNYSLYTFTLVILLDTAYVCIRRKGIDFKWFSPAYFAYSTQIIISGWIVQSALNNEDNIDCQNDNITNTMMLHLSHCGLVKLNIYFNLRKYKNLFYLNKKIRSLNLCQTLSLYLCFFLVAIIISKRITPICIPEKMHSTLYIGLISASADIVDFIDYANEEEKIEYFGINFIWSLIKF